MPDNSVTLQLTITVTYALNGASRSEMERHLHEAAGQLAADGAFTQFSEAEVENWTETVQEVAG